MWVDLVPKTRNEHDDDTQTLSEEQHTHIGFSTVPFLRWTYFPKCTEEEEEQTESVEGKLQDAMTLLLFSKSISISYYV